MFDKFPLLFLVSGPSGVSKVTITRALLARVPKLKKAVTYTTRSKRPGEEEGRDYFFIPVEQFRLMIDKDAMFEYHQINKDYFYGSPTDIFSQSVPGTDLLLEVDPRGMKLYKGRYPKAISIWLMPASIATLISQPGAMTANTRLSNIEEQLADAGRYDYIVRNDSLDDTLEQLAAIILAERCKSRKSLLLDDLEQELAQLQGHNRDTDNAVN